MHRGLSYWPRTGVVYDTNADYVCPPHTGSRGDNLDNKPQAYCGHTCLWAVWLLGETVVNVDRLVVCRAAPGEGLLHRTSIALCLERGLSQSDRLFPSVQKTSHGYQYKNKISPAQWGSCAGLETSICVPKPNPTETEKERRKTQIRMRRPEA